jgi:pre-mRNA-processing factor SLU7
MLRNTSHAVARCLGHAQVREAVRKQEEWQRRDHTAEADDRKRGYNSTTAIDVTAEDMEAYRLKKTKRDDPMAAFADSEELLDYDGGGAAGRKR